MTDAVTLAPLDRTARTLGMTAGLLAVAVGFATVVGLPSAGITGPDPGRSASLLLVVVVTAVVVWRRALSARLSLLYGIPALTLTSSWWAAPTTDAWFAYSVQGSPATPPGPGATGIVVAVLLLVLWVLTGVGWVATARGAGAVVPVRLVAVAAMVLTVPIWMSVGASRLAAVPSAPTPQGAVRIAALVLVLIVGALVLTDRRPPSVWTAAYVLPATLLTWVGWQTLTTMGYVEVAPGYAVASSAIALTDLVLLPALLAPVASTVLVAVLWLLAVSGTIGLGRFLPPPARTA